MLVHFLYIYMLSQIVQERMCRYHHIIWHQTFKIYFLSFHLFIAKFTSIQICLVRPQLKWESKGVAIATSFGCRFESGRSEILVFVFDFSNLYFCSLLLVQYSIFHVSTIVYSCLCKCSLSLSLQPCHWRVISYHIVLGLSMIYK